MEDFNFKKYIAENKLLKEAIDFPEMEDEFEGYQDAMLGSDEEYLQGVIDVTPEEFSDLNGGYYEVALGIEQGRYSAEDAVELAKSWAKEKLAGLSENKPIKEDKEYSSNVEAHELLDMIKDEIGNLLLDNDLVIRVNQTGMNGYDVSFETLGR